jgi:hypothetical protein
MTTPIKIKPVAIECFFFYAFSLLGDYGHRGNDKFLEAHINVTAGEKGVQIFTGHASPERRRNSNDEFWTMQICPDFEECQICRAMRLAFR